MSSISMPATEERLTYEEGKKWLDTKTARVTRASNDVTRRNLMVEDAQQKVARALAEAQRSFETDDVEKLRAELDRRLLANGAAVAAFERDLTAAEEYLTATAKYFQAEPRPAGPAPR